jgi:hypothetical protein
VAGDEPAGTGLKHDPAGGFTTVSRTHLAGWIDRRLSKEVWRQRRHNSSARSSGTVRRGGAVVGEASKVVLHAQPEMRRTPQLKDEDEDGSTRSLTTAAAPRRCKDGGGYHRRSRA